MPDDVADARALFPFVGTWDVEAEFRSAGLGSVRGRMTFDWLLGQQFLVQRAETDHPDAPDVHAIMGPDPGRPGGYRQHYFDSRGVVRLYVMTFDGREWTLLRTRPDFTPLAFAQRYVGTFSDDGATIAGRWETSSDGTDWQLDFDLTYRRIG